MSARLSAEMLLAGYAQGIFPMAESRDNPVLHWFEPKRRGIIPLTGFHISRSLRQRLLRAPFVIRVNTAFRQTVLACAERDETWINAALVHLYEQLHAQGHAHSLEVWQDDRLVGGVFGVTLGGAYFGESMFSRETDASKIALAYCVDRLRQGGFSLFDTQYLTAHLASLGGKEIVRDHYRTLLAQALPCAADFTAPATPAPQLLLQRMTQMS